MDMSIRFPGLNLVLDYVPRSFEIFGFEITIYGILIAAGMLLGIFFAVLEARRNHEDADACLDLAIVTLITGVIGARLFYVAFSWSLYKNDPGQILNGPFRRNDVLRGTFGRRDRRSTVLPHPPEIFLADGRYCMCGSSHRTDNRKVGMFL